MMRLGLCCKFLKEPIKFHTTTARYVSGLSSAARRRKISQLCLANAVSLMSAIEYCHQSGIGSFRVNSRILPLKTHPVFGYEVQDIAKSQEIRSTFMQCGSRAEEYGIRLTFHPDQFILLSSPDREVTRKSILELEYQAEVSKWIGADVINIHGGGGYGDREAALQRVVHALDLLSEDIRERLTFENDDRIFTPSHLLPVCEKYGIPFVYDVHHHRCLPDQLSVEQATSMALKTWNREPLFHISSPKFGWESSKPTLHHDYIDIHDFPRCWRGLNITVEVEAKAKELAVQKLANQVAATR